MKQQMEVSVEKFDGIFVPIMLQMNCTDSASEKYRVVTMNWETVNKPMASGLAGAELLAKKFGCSIVDLREQK